MSQDLKRAREDGSEPVPEQPSKRLRGSAKYFLCGVYEDGDSLMGDVFTPLTPNGHKVADGLLKLRDFDRSEALVQFVRVFNDDTIKKEAERKELLKIIKKYFPFLDYCTSFSDVKELGAMEPWNESLCLPVIPIYVCFAY